MIDKADAGTHLADDLFKPCPKCRAELSEGTIEGRYDWGERLHTYWCKRCGYVETQPCTLLVSLIAVADQANQNGRIYAEALLQAQAAASNGTLFYVPETKSLWTLIDGGGVIEEQKLDFTGIPVTFRKVDFREVIRAECERLLNWTTVLRKEGNDKGFLKAIAVTAVLKLWLGTDRESIDTFPGYQPAEAAQALNNLMNGRSQAVNPSGLAAFQDFDVRYPALGNLMKRTTTWLIGVCESGKAPFDLTALINDTVFAGKITI